eukprot:22764_1
MTVTGAAGRIVTNTPPVFCTSRWVGLLGSGRLVCCGFQRRCRMGIRREHVAMGASNQTPFLHLYSHPLPSEQHQES